MFLAKGVEECFLLDSIVRTTSLCHAVEVSWFLGQAHCPVEWSAHLLSSTLSSLKGLGSKPTSP